MKDYLKELKKVNSLEFLKSFTIGKEIVTPLGKGIIVKSEMPENGLFIGPEKTKITVWFSTERARIDTNSFVKKEFKIQELLPDNVLEIEGLIITTGDYISARLDNDLTIEGYVFSENGNLVLQETDFKMTVSVIKLSEIKKLPDVQN